MFNRVQKEINQIINRGFDRTLICTPKPGPHDSARFLTRAWKSISFDSDFYYFHE